MKSKINLTYIFSGGRKSRLDSDEIYAKDFFYGYFEFDKLNVNKQIVDIEHKKIFILNYLDKLIKKLLNYPISLSSIFNTPFTNQVKNSDIIILVNESVMFFALPNLFLLKKKNKNLRTALFTMGLFSNFSNNKYKKYLQDFFISKFCLNVIDKFLFLGKQEYEYAVKNYPTKVFKFEYVPFGIDTHFWKNSNSYNLSERKYILFIGNDLRRDYDFVLDLADKLHDIEFIFLSSRINKNQVSRENVKLISGMWWNNKVSDVEIKSLYSNAIVTILPLKNSLQPSGQSVALQSMSMGTPVLITKTDGFWDYEKFEHQKDIIFLDENNIDLWREAIDRLLARPELLKEISNNSKKIVNQNFNLTKFSSNIELFLDLK